MSSNTTLSGANIVLLNKAGVIMSNQHHGIVQLGPRQHITELYRYGYNLSNIWSVSRGASIHYKCSTSHPEKIADC